MPVINLLNLFTPSEIASAPDDFFGRSAELQTLKRSLRKGSVAIQGAMGIGKSSLLSRICLMMEGLKVTRNPKPTFRYVIGILTISNLLSRRILEGFISIDEKTRKFSFKLPGKVVEIESAEVHRYFTEGRHLATLKRLIEKDYLSTLVDPDNFLIFAIDEADKCPILLARLFRDLATHTQQRGIKNVRFIFCGINPFYQAMVEEDNGVARFIYQTMDVPPLQEEDADDLLEAKFSAVCEEAVSEGIELYAEPDMLTQVRLLSGGHPHVLQLLGSHNVEHENEDPDGVIDVRDLIGSLRRICYEDRASIYDSILENLTMNAMREPFIKILARMDPGFPSRISKGLTREIIERPDDIEWLIRHNIIAIDDHSYVLTDEFIRIRILMDEQDSNDGRIRLERHFLQAGNREDYIFDFEDELEGESEEEFDEDLEDEF